jgi:hypothetical protein
MEASTDQIGEVLADYLVSDGTSGALLFRVRCGYAPDSALRAAGAASV